MFPIGNIPSTEGSRMPPSPPPPPAPPPGSSPTELYTLFTSAKAVGELIRARRTAAGLTQLAASRRCRVGRRCFIEVENGKATARLDKVLSVLAGMGLLAIVVPYEAAQAALGQR